VSFETIKVGVAEGIGTITLNRPEMLNAFNTQLMQDVSRAVSGFTDDAKVGAIVVHGEGRAFSSGFDMKEALQQTTTGPEQWLARLERDFDFIMQFWDCPKPSVAAIHGYCIGGAFELALACDITVAAAGTRLGEPEVRNGSGMIALLLPWMTTPKIAKELLLTGNDRIDAERALAIGIVNYVVPPGEELAKAMELARAIATAAPLSVKLTKRAINRGYEAMGMREALLAALEMVVMITTDDGPERQEFRRIQREQGLKAALAMRDARMGQRP
jgi:enoyl-CoA hydratase